MTGKQKKALAALLSASTVRDAAAAAGISYATLRRWIAEDSEFRREYKSELQSIVESAAAQARQGMGEALKVLRSIANDEEAPSNARVSAAKVLVENGPKIIEVQDFEARIERLEARDNEY